MVGIGIVGIGFMGMIHYLAARGLTGGRVVAVCSRDPKKLAGDWTGIRGNFGPRGGTMDLSGLNRHADVADLLADPAVDLVDLCVPNDEHARLAVRALEAGKHVLVEKPVALTTADADAMLRAARATGKRLLVAHVLPFFPEFSFVAEAVTSGRYGARTCGGSSPSPTGRPGSPTPTAAAGRRSTCISTTPTSSAWSAACPWRSRRAAWSTAARWSTSPRSTCTTTRT